MNVIHPLTDAQKRKRRPDGRVIEDGETLSFNIALVRDAASAGTGRTYLTDAERTSIDATVKAEIERRAKLGNQKPSEFLASLQPRDLERLIEQAAKAHVAAIGNEAVAKSFALDCVVRRVVDAEHGAHDGRFAFMGNTAPKFDRANAEFLARQRLATDAQRAADNSRALAAGRYQDAARAAAITGLNSWRGGHYAAEHETRVADAQSARASINALRAARYTGE